MTALHIETPYFESQALSRHAERAIWLKMEALQPPGSFKIRGVGLACQTHAQRGVKRFISSSGGNAGIAVAYAGRQLSIPVTVVVPQTATERAQALIRLEGAEVMVHGASWQEANALAVSLLTPSDAFIHPFDDPLLWQGHASMVDEMAAQGKKPDAIVLSVGGGGLLCGVVEGLHRNGWADVPVIAVETRGADSFAQSVAAGERITMPAITSRTIQPTAWKLTGPLPSAMRNPSQAHRPKPAPDNVVLDEKALHSQRGGVRPRGLGRLRGFCVRPACGGRARLWRGAGRGLWPLARAGAFSNRGGDRVWGRHGQLAANAAMGRGQRQLNHSCPGQFLPCFPFTPI